jgi:hypothetical protein
VHAAAGGTGLLLVQMVRLAGGRVIGTVSTRERAALATEAGVQAPSLPSPNGVRMRYVPDRCWTSRKFTPAARTSTTT